MRRTIDVSPISRIVQRPGVKATLVVLFIAGFATAPAAAAGASSPSLCDSEKLKYLFNSGIQLAIYGGVALSTVVYFGGETLERLPIPKDRRQQVRKQKKDAAVSVVKLPGIAAVLALLLKGSPLAWSSCIELVPF